MLLDLRTLIKEWFSGKQAPRKSLKPDRGRIQVQDADDIMIAGSAEAEDSVQEDVLRASESPALDDVRELLSPPQSPGTTTVKALNESGCRVDKAKEPEVALEDPISTKIDLATPIPSSNEDVPTSSPKVRIRSMEPGVVGIESPDAIGLPAIDDSRLQTLAMTPSTKPNLAETGISGNSPPAIVPSCEPNLAISEPSEAVILPPLAGSKLTKSDIEIDDSKQAAHSPSRPAPMSTSPSSSKMMLSKRLIDAVSPGGSPQIGTSLLRRETLRRKESPSKQKPLRKGRSPKKKRDTLQRRDTLQERDSAEGHC